MHKGVLLIDKAEGKTSFSLVTTLRKLLNVSKIGHAGTLDPFATGVMVMLIGREYTRLSDKFLSQDKEYLAQVRLGIATSTYDPEGDVTEKSDKIPSEKELLSALKDFQGKVEQIPPMFSAKKQNGKKLYELARKGIAVERKPVLVDLKTQLLSYDYPYVNLKIACSKGTYIRSIAHDLGVMLACGAHLSQLQRTRSGSFHIDDCFDGQLLHSPNLDIHELKTRIRHDLIIE